MNSSISKAIQWWFWEMRHDCVDWIGKCVFHCGLYEALLLYGGQLELAVEY